MIIKFQVKLKTDELNCYEMENVWIYVYDAVSLINSVFNYILVFDYFLMDHDLIRGFIKLAPLTLLPRFPPGFPNRLVEKIFPFQWQPSQGSLFRRENLWLRILLPFQK